VPLERISQGFKDISMSFQTNPLTSDLIAMKNENAIARSVKNIVFTNPGEKFFNPRFGSRITESLFENADELTAIEISTQIEESINRYEPRVKLRSVDANANIDGNSFDVVITYDIIGADIPPQQLEFVLQPTR
jgi:phage baseplate assembly protein W|tara:strand:- start:16354 stop:16755 length:402 start_codon:yes stop_codon:yes gene_type:complete